MSLEGDLYTKLNSSTARALSGLATGKIYQNALPIGKALPALVYSRVSDTPVHAMGADANLRAARFQFDCLSTSPSQGKTVAEGVMTSLRDFSGQLTGTSTGITVQRIFFDGLMSDVIIDADVKRTVFRYALDFIIWSTEV